jgi:hypothetical protein
LSGPAVGAARRRLYQSSQRKTPVFSVLPQGYGYFDLVRLTVPQVNEAFDTVKDTPALIMDMRGYPQGTAWSICARLTAEPITMKEGIVAGKVEVLEAAIKFLDESKAR